MNWLNLGSWPDCILLYLNISVYMFWKRATVGFRKSVCCLEVYQHTCKASEYNVRAHINHDFDSASILLYTNATPAIVCISKCTLIFPVQLSTDKCTERPVYFYFISAHSFLCTFHFQTPPRIPLLFKCMSCGYIDFSCFSIRLITVLRFHLF